MVKNTFLLLVAATLFASCATFSSMMSADRNMKHVEINMTKAEVIAIMGDVYELVGGTESVEVIGYKTADEGMYKLYFEKGILKEWRKEWIIPKSGPHGCGNSHRPAAAKEKDDSGLRNHLDAHRNAMLSTASSDSERQHINTHMDAHTKSVLGH